MKLKTTLLILATVASSVAFAQVDTPTVDLPDTNLNKANIIPVFTVSADGLESTTESQDVSGLLQSSRDVFLNVAGFNFSAARYRFRGYSSENMQVMMNGIPMNDRESGWAIWAYWGGLNDITRYPENRAGISSAQMGFGGVGGFSNINLRPTAVRKGTRVSYALTNRTYRQRAIVTHSSGMQENGWAYAVSGAFRYSQEGYVDGSSFNGGSYFASVMKKINDKHSLTLSGFGAPTVQARQGISVQEAYTLTGDNFYNPYWGYQSNADGTDSTKRNARVRDNHKPYVFLTHDFKISSKKKLTTTVYGVFGKTANSNLNWYEAPDPRPDYYRYLPSYNAVENPGIAALQTLDWTNGGNTNVTQINWDGLYNANYKNLFTIEDPNGEVGTTLTGNRSKYVVEEYRQDPRQFGLKAIYTAPLNDKFYLATGAQADIYKSKNYKVMQDLLGGEYWVDVDQFAERDFSDSLSAQNDLANYNNIIEEGDVFGYNYDINVHTYNAYANVDMKTKKVDGYLGVNLSNTTFWRTGHMQNGRFPDESLGDSEKQNFFNYGVKAGVTYKVTGRHLITANMAYLTRAPLSRNSYVSPKTRDHLVKNLESTEVISGDINYHIRYPNLRARITAFYTQINNQVWARSFYHDEYNAFVNYVMTDVDQLFYGTEIGVEYTLASVWVLSGAFTTGDYIYSNRPKATITADNTQELIAEDRTIYLKNYDIGGMPQLAGTIGLKYNSPKYWFAGANWNYFDRINLGPNPDRRTEEAVSAFVVTDPQWNETLDVTELDNGYTVNLFGGKSWRLSSGKFLRLFMSVSNVLNNTDFKTGGYEQLRYNPGEIGKFPPKYGYMYGLTYFAMVTYQF